MEIMLRGQDGALTYDFEPVPNIVASNGVPLIKLKSPDILYAGSESFTFEVRLTFEPQHEISNNVVCATCKSFKSACASGSCKKESKHFGVLV